MVGPQTDEHFGGIKIKESSKLICMDSLCFCYPRSILLTLSSTRQVEQPNKSFVGKLLVSQRFFFLSNIDFFRNLLGLFERSDRLLKRLMQFQITRKKLMKH